MLRQEKSVQLKVRLGHLRLGRRQGNEERENEENQRGEAQPNFRTYFRGGGGG